MAPETIGELIRSRARELGNSPAILSPGSEFLSYGELEIQLGEVTSSLRSQGVGRNDRVALVLQGGPNLAAAILCVAANAVCVPLNPEGRQETFEANLAALRPTLLLTDMQSGPAVEAAKQLGIRILGVTPHPSGTAGRFTIANSRAHPSPDHEGACPNDVALILHTSGTTSYPKRVPLSHRNLLCAAQNFVRDLEVCPSDRCLTFLPLFHVMGIISGLIAPLLGASSVVITSQLRIPDFFKWINEFRPTWYSAVPTMHRLILDHADEFREILAAAPLRFVRSGGAPLPVSVLQSVESLLAVPVIEAYGLTETGTPITSTPLPPGIRKPGTVGRSVGPEVAILGPDGQFLPTGSPGEVVIRGPTVMKAYLDDLAGNSSAFFDGWFRTGDLGVLDSDAYLKITGRLKEIINRSGEKIAPREVEDVLISHPGVLQAVVFGAPHPTLGEEIAAAVVPRRGYRLSEQELKRFCSNLVPSTLMPRRIVFLSEVPKGPTGKIQRIGLAGRLGVQFDVPAGGGRAPPRSDLERNLTQIWEAVLGRSPVFVDENFFDLGGDSLIAVRLLERVNQEFRRRFPISLLIEAPTIRQFARFMETRTSGPKCLVRIQQGRTLPFIFVHGADGGIWPFTKLARALGSQITVYALRAIGLEEDIPLTSVGECSDNYLREMREAGLRGPYRLGGFCGGAVIALEMARQLRAAGESVSLITILDPPPSLWRKKNRSIKGACAEFIEGLRQTIAGLEAAAVQTVAFSVQTSMLVSFLVGWYLVSGFSAPVRRRIRTWLSQLRAVRSYSPQVHDCDLLVFHCVPPRWRSHVERALSELSTAQTRFVRHHGGHYSLFSGLNASRMARVLRGYAISNG